MNTQEIETIETAVVTDDMPLVPESISENFCRGRVLGSKEEALRVIDYLLAHGGNAAALRKYAGCLENSPTFKGDPVAIQRKMRGYDD